MAVRRENAVDFPESDAFIKADIQNHARNSPHTE